MKDDGDLELGKGGFEGPRRSDDRDTKEDNEIQAKLEQ